MKNKITILIIASVLGLIALSSIQAYLISNTYELKKKAFIKETDDALEGIHNQNELDSLSNVWKEDLRNHLNDYKSNRITKAEVLNRFFIKTDSLNTMHATYYKKELEHINLGYDVKFKQDLISIIIIEGSKSDTIYPVRTEFRNKIFGQEFNTKEGHQINKSSWYTESEYIHQEDGEIVKDTYDLEVKNISYIQIKDWKRIVYRRMAALFFGSLLLFLFVIGLLYYSIKNLVTQKKIADIKTDFINNITHELKTPLATLSIATKSLKNETIKANPDAFNNTLNIVDRQNERLQKLIDQVMTNSLSNEDIVLHKEQVLDNVYFNNIIEDFKLAKQHSGLTIKNEILTSEIVIRLDKFHFATAILNILENAVKYSAEPTIITFKTEIKNSNYCLKISDNGIGISQKNQKHLFDKFYRVGDGNVHDVKGLGLGLYYTSQIIKAHQGVITLESELNKGTTFTIKIPVN
ncbi:sensor histidine kinase [Lacinutrix jangbogonensis]|uniref:sensor histidine kinase n=1 Tax=Lacinutrix jangbogonensis TaxID=1469557 RepID=UPI00053EE145|nr:HAMP domain-containing sensor histidine kinase [Lacinutrix jangbogonensis]